MTDLEFTAKLWSGKGDYIRVVGGNFRLKGADSAPQYVSLCKVLRLSIYLYLSLLLEQHLLLNSHVELQLAKVTLPTIATMPLMDVAASAQQESRRRQRGESTLPSGLWSFVTKQTGNLLHRAVNVTPSLVRRGSLDLPATKSHHSDGRSTVEGPYRRGRRFSLIGSPSLKGQPKLQDTPQKLPFTMTIEAIESFKDLLSTSPGLEFPPPRILMQLVEKEKNDAPVRLMGDERAALSNVLGWEGKAAQARGMTGTLGFVRHQWISALYSEHVPVLLPNTQPATPASSRPPSVASSRPSTSSSLHNPPRFACCGNRRRWITYRYYSDGDGSADESLGDAITRMCSSAGEQCQVPGCQHKRAEHDFRWIHNGTRIVATIAPASESQDPAGPVKDDTPRMWSRCAVCGAESRKQQMSDGT